MQHGVKSCSVGILLLFPFKSKSFDLNLSPYFTICTKSLACCFCTYINIHYIDGFQSICLYGSLYRTLPLPLCALWKRSKFR